MPIQIVLCMHIYSCSQNVCMYTLKWLSSLSSIHVYAHVRSSLYVSSLSNMYIQCTCSCSQKVCMYICCVHVHKHICSVHVHVHTSKFSLPLQGLVAVRSEDVLEVMSEDFPEK